MNATKMWLKLLQKLIFTGCRVAPRGQDTFEILHNTIEVSMLQPVLISPTRKLNYQFMSAEAYWILTGDNRVETIAPYNKNISNFSDDGKIFFGAYGPKIISQLDYVVDKLIYDAQSRQAGLTIWRENPPETKDVPCTIAIFFTVREGCKVQTSVFMRSSDAWLGIPYDIFNFSMLTALVCAKIYEKSGMKLVPDMLRLTAASSHLYARDYEKAMACITDIDTIQAANLDESEMPEACYRDSNYVLNLLNYLKDTKRGDEKRWWEVQDAKAN